MDVITELVSTLWNNYDIERTGMLDRIETKIFVKDILKSVKRDFNES